MVLYSHRGDNPINYLEATEMTTNEILDVLAENESKLPCVLSIGRCK